MKNEVKKSKSRKTDYIKKSNLNYSFKNINIQLLVVTLCLVCFGLIMVYSASYYSADLNYGNKYYFLIKQSVGAIVGVFAMIFAMNFDYHKLEKMKWYILIISIVLLILVFVPLISVENYGAKRWINLGFITIQPSEIAKFGFVIWCSAYLSKNYKKVKKFKGLLPVLFFGGIICVLIILEPNMSITMCVGITMIIMLFVGGITKKHFLLLSIPLIALVPVLIIIEPYRFARLTAFLNPWLNPKGEGYQLIQSLYSLGAGGLFGVGLFNSRQKYMFLPFAESDFIFSIIGEELGLFGSVMVILLFALLIYNGFKIAFHSKDRFGSFLSTGITSVIGIQVLINIAVVSGSIPPTGVPLPFISSGGTALVVFMFAIGVLLNISKQNNKIMNIV